MCAWFLNRHNKCGWVNRGIFVVVESLIHFSDLVVEGDVSLQVRNLLIQIVLVLD